MSAERAIYLDSSAIVKLALAEKESSALRRYLRRRAPVSRGDPPRAGRPIVRRGLIVSIPYDEGVYLDKPWLTIRWDAEHQCVHAEFRAFANSAEFRAGCQTILTAIKERKAFSLISDNRRLEGVTGEDQLWLRDNWFPQAVAAGLTRIATVLAPRGLGRIASEEIIRQAGKDKPSIRTFDSMPEALKWVAPA